MNNSPFTHLAYLEGVSLFKRGALALAKLVVSILPLLLLSLLLIGCGSDTEATSTNTSQSACEGNSLTGEWFGVTVPSDILTVNSDCTGYDSYCEASFTWAPINDDGTITIHFLSTKGGSFCPSVPGVYDCAINEQPQDLTIDCGAGALVYER